MSRGHDRERAVRCWLEERGWFVARAAGSLGDVDLVALRAFSFAISPIHGKYQIAGTPELEGRPVIFGKLLVEVKSTKAGPFAGFGPQDRAELLKAGEIAGADVVLCWWPPSQGKRIQPRWLWPDEWPEAKRKAA